MYKLVVASVLLCIMLLESLVVMAAPLSSRRLKRHANEMDTTDAQPRISVQLREDGMSDTEQRVVSDDLSSTIDILANIEDELNEQVDHVPRRRHRRSAPWVLHATLRWCNQYPSRCSRVDISDGDLKVTIRLAEQ